MASKIVAYADTGKRKNMAICKLWCAGTDATYQPGQHFPVAGKHTAFLYGVTERQLDLFLEIKKRKIDYYYCDNGYAPCQVAKANGQLMEMFRITKNAPQYAGQGGPCDMERGEIYMPDIKPWRPEGRDILVCLQSDWHHRVWANESRSEWLDKVLDTLDVHTDRPVIIRDKPLRNKKEVPFEKALKTAYAVVTFNSRVAIEAILAGVPAFVTDPNCAAAPMAEHDLTRIEHPKRSDDRAEWRGRLAANQWTRTEIGAGYALKMLKKRENS